MEHSFFNASRKQLPGLLGRNRMAEIITLSLATPVALKELQLRAGFYTFCDYTLV
jgi:hypothetical protein